MTSFHAFLAISLDGYIADASGGVEWLAAYEGDGAEDYGYGAFVGAMDAIVIGRGSYETVLAFPDWPYAKPVMVLSQSLPAPTDDTPVDILTDTPQEFAIRAAANGWSRVYVDGGRLVQSFLDAGLLADIVLTQAPILLGGGRPLFQPMKSARRLRQTRTTVYPAGLVSTHYMVDYVDL